MLRRTLLVLALSLPALMHAPPTADPTPEPTMTAADVPAASTVAAASDVTALDIETIALTVDAAAPTSVTVAARSSPIEQPMTPTSIRRSRSLTINHPGPANLHASPHLPFQRSDRLLV